MKIPTVLDLVTKKNYFSESANKSPSVTLYL
jgi:hypothetical protein